MAPNTLRAARLAVTVLCSFAAMSIQTVSSAAAQVTISISIDVVPPALPVYVQPPLPEPGYIWVPGYWAWDPDEEDFYWVPGAWIAPPRPGLLWTPGYWAWNGGVYVFYSGYWASEVGFYGGIDYGYGYTGSGYWRGSQFFLQPLGQQYHQRQRSQRI